MVQTRRSTQSKGQATLSFKSTGAKVSKPLKQVGKKSVSPSRSIQKLKIDSGASTPVKELSKSPVTNIEPSTAPPKPKVLSEDEKFAERIPQRQINDYYKKKIVANQFTAPSKFRFLVEPLGWNATLTMTQFIKKSLPPTRRSCETSTCHNSMALVPELLASIDGREHRTLA